MSRLGKKAKEEWSFFIGKNGRRQYNTICRRCREPCKQSFRAKIVCCLSYQPKRQLKG